jgi:DNA helicase-2/ATP-dependent DNA helicase PcrA
MSLPTTSSRNLGVSRKVEIILGPPGTGKTTRLLGMLERYLNDGGSMERVAFVSFSRRAIKEVAVKLGKDLDEFPYFRTIHSLAYHFLNLDRDDVFQYKHWQTFSDIVGIPFAAAGHEEPVWDGTVGDKVMALHNLARSRETDLEHEWRTAMLPNLTLRTLHDTVRAYEKFKHTNALWDFHDMIAKADGTLPVDLLFVDEAQDTSKASWSFLRRSSKDVPHVVLAGDDDQAVYAWSGADATALGRFLGDRTVLPQSYRLPRRIKLLAGHVISRVKQRVEKEFHARVDEDGREVEGEVTYRNEVSTINLRDTESWLLLARSNYQLEEYRQLARSQGVVYTLPDGEWSHSLPPVRAAITYERLRKGQEVPRSEVRAMLQFGLHQPKKLPPVVKWDDLYSEQAMEQSWMVGLPHISPSDREYIRALRQGGEKLNGPGRVRIGTVHSVKGAEADNVVLKSDISERVTYGARIDPDSEHRVQYVGVTRAAKALHVILPQTATHWVF